MATENSKVISAAAATWKGAPRTSGGRQSALPRKTRYQGIEEIATGIYRIRVRTWNRRTGKMDEIDRRRRCTEREAAVLQLDWRRELEADAARPGASQALGDFGRSWLAGRLNILLPPTIDRYTAGLEDHILPVLGHLAVEDVTHDDVERFRDAKKAEGYASATVNGFLRLVKTVLADASARLGIPNAAARVQALPEDDTRITDEEPNALTIEEARAFMAAARDRWPEHFAMIFTLIVTGARMSQVCALRWEDIDEQRGEIRFRRRRYLDHVYAGVKGRTPAARKKVHVVALTEDHAEVLRAHQRLLEECQHRGASSGWCFPADTGGTHSNSILDKPFKDLRAHIGLAKRFTPHGLRRTCTDVTRQVASAVVTKAITGHLTDQMHEHYSTVGIGEQRAAMQKVVALLGGGPPVEGGGSSGGPAAEGRRSGRARRARR